MKWVLFFGLLHFFTWNHRRALHFWLVLFSQLEIFLWNYWSGSSFFWTLRFLCETIVVSCNSLSTGISSQLEIYVKSLKWVIFRFLHFFFRETVVQCIFHPIGNFSWNHSPYFWTFTKIVVAISSIWYFPSHLEIFTCKHGPHFWTFQGSRSNFFHLVFFHHLEIFTRENSPHFWTFCEVVEQFISTWYFLTIRKFLRENTVFIFGL